MAVIIEPEPPIGSITKLTATAHIPGWGLVNNRDALGWWGDEGQPVFYGVRTTLPGTNGTDHQWIGPLTWYGVACHSTQCENNCVITWIYLGRNGAAAGELMKKHPNEFGDSR